MDVYAQYRGGPGGELLVGALALGFVAFIAWSLFWIALSAVALARGRHEQARAFWSEGSPGLRVLVGLAAALGGMVVFTVTIAAVFETYAVKEALMLYLKLPWLVLGEDLPVFVNDALTLVWIPLALFTIPFATALALAEGFKKLHKKLPVSEPPKD